MIGCNATAILILGQLEFDVRPTLMFGVKLNNFVPQKGFIHFVIVALTDTFSY